MISGPLDIVIPVKGGAAAKSRLASALSPRARAALAFAMARHVIATARAASAVRSTIVVTSCDEVARLASSLGARVLRDERDAGTAVACAQALGHCRADTALLFLNADLPLLSRDVLERMLRSSDRVVIAPDRRRIGTNALLLPAGSAIAPGFGQDSFSRHVAAATAAGEPLTVFSDPATATDIDEPADLAALGVWKGRLWIDDMEHAC